MEYLHVGSGKSTMQTSILGWCVRVALGLSVLLLLVICIAVFLSFFRQPATPVFPNEDLLQVVHFDFLPSLNNPELEIVKRPLFWSSRKPVPSADELAEDSNLAPMIRNKALDQVRLAGVFSEGKVFSALVILKKQEHTLSVNDFFLGWEVVQIFPNAVVFRRSGEEPLDQERKVLELSSRPSLTGKWQSENVLKQNN